jgi:hypothetical protein
MTRAGIFDRRAGRYRSAVAAAFDRPDFVEWLSGIRAHLDDPSAVALTSGRNRLVRVIAPVGGVLRPVVVKAFGVSALASPIAWVRGSKAERTWRVATALAARGVGTPEPSACLERWTAAGRLAESYYICSYEPGVSTFKHELIRLFREDPMCGRFMALMEAVALSVRRLHDAGLQHNDLGNQNILVRRDGSEGWHDVMFVDLNRARVHRTLSLRQRARDLSRLYLPSDLLRVFFEMYWHPDVPPPGLLNWERRFRRAYALHCATRAWRHPLRDRSKRVELPSERYPAECDMWIWDERSGQAISALRSRDRKRFQPLGGFVEQCVAVLRSACAVRRHYRRLRASAFGSPVPMAGRLRVAAEGVPETVALEMALLARLGDGVPVHVRLYHHEGQERLAQRLEVARALKAAGHAVSASLVQDRRAVLEPAAWDAFVGRSCAGLAGVADWVEVGHAVNRVKWGLWSPHDYGRLVRPLVEMARRYPKLRFTGPAGIDFEYPFVLAALREVPSGVRFSALSHHLYVDRRGGPENRQGRFSTLEKLALGRAIAAASAVCEERYIVSEVNWPLLGTGVYSPVGSPYESPGTRTNDPSVSESQYAEYMVRYLAIALCSGMADEVVWWRLAAHGYGLVDDRAADGAWREREAFSALALFIRTVGQGTFVRRMPPEEWGGGGGDAVAHALVFTQSASTVVLAWTSGEPVAFLPHDTVAKAFDVAGASVPSEGAGYTLTGRPIYFVMSPRR